LTALTCHRLETNSFTYSKVDVADTAGGITTA
jgi:hypothetical protein